MSSPDIDAAQQFLAANARVLEWRRFERLFGGGGPDPVRAAVAAYRARKTGTKEHSQDDGAHHDA